MPKSRNAKTRRRIRAREPEATKGAGISRQRVMVMALLILTLSVYAQVVDHQFINYDDNDYVTQNPVVREGMTWGGIVWAFTTGHSANWHPLTWLSHMLDTELFGLQPGAHHLVSVAFHLFNTVLVLLVFHRATGDFWPGMFVASIFALHPLHVESVAWIAERKDLLCTTFWMLTTLWYIRYVRNPQRATYAMLLLFFVLGAMSKPMIVTLPVVLLLMDVWPLKRIRTGTLLQDLRKVIPEKVPLFALALISGVITFLVQRHQGSVLTLQSLPVATRLGNSIEAYLTYLVKMFWPTDLAPFYPHPGGQLESGTVLLSLLALLAITALILVVSRNRTYPLVGWLWYLVVLLPVIGIIQVGAQSHADRYTYIPMIGLSVILAWGVPELIRTTRLHSAKIFTWGGVVLVGLMSAATWQQVGYWKNSETLFGHAARAVPGNWLAHLNVGRAYEEDGRFTEAIREFSEAARLNPNQADIHYALGSALHKAERTQEAERHYAAALALSPHHWQALYGMGLVLQSEGKVEEAISRYAHALRLKQDFAPLHYNNAVALHSLQRFPEAIEHYAAVLRLQPSNADAHSNMGAALQTEGRFQEAERHYREALRIRPDHVAARNNLEALYRAMGRPEESR